MEIKQKCYLQILSNKVRNRIKKLSMGIEIIPKNYR